MSATTPPAKSRRTIRVAMLGATAQPMSNAVREANYNAVRMRSTFAVETYNNCEDDLSPTELTEWSPDQRTECESQDEEGQAERKDFMADVKLFQDLVWSGSICTCSEGDNEC